jgi:hypothetical protein
MMQIHSNALESSNVAYHEFLLCYRSIEQIVYGFVEGKDDPSFYRGFIERNLPSGWKVKLIRSGNKQKVLRVFEVMDWNRFPYKRVCFFIDRDLSVFLGGETHSGENLYVTDCYAIENEIVSFDTMERVLEETLGVTNALPAEFTRIKDLFNVNLRFFCNAMAPVMGQILLWKRNGEKPCLSNIEPKEFFQFTHGEIGLNPKFSSSIDRVLRAAALVSAQAAATEDLSNAEAEFRSKQGPERFTRGKYLLWFFVQCANEIHQSISLFCTNHTVSPKACVSLGVGNAMAMIAPRARCPESLNNFLDRNYGEYTKEVRLAG